MRQLNLNEKISIKGQLATKGVCSAILAKLGMADAIRLYWMCFGRPVATHSLPTMWRKRTLRTGLAH